MACVAILFRRGTGSAFQLPLCIVLILFLRLLLCVDRVVHTRWLELELSFVFASSVFVGRPLLLFCIILWSSDCNVLWSVCPNVGVFVPVLIGPFETSTFC